MWRSQYNKAAAEEGYTSNFGTGTGTATGTATTDEPSTILCIAAAAVGDDARFFFII